MRSKVTAYYAQANNTASMPQKLQNHVAQDTPEFCTPLPTAGRQNFQAIVAHRFRGKVSEAFLCNLVLHNLLGKMQYVPTYFAVRCCCDQSLNSKMAMLPHSKLDLTVPTQELSSSMPAMPNFVQRQQETSTAAAALPRKAQLAFTSYLFRTILSKISGQEETPK